MARATRTFGAAVFADLSPRLTSRGLSFLGMMAGMNMLVLESHDEDQTLPRTDRRYVHITRILKKGPGDELLAGCVGGMVGTALIEADDGSALRLRFRPEREAPALLPLVALLGFPRPIQAGRIVKDLTSLGISRIALSGSELGEKSYFQSDFFKNKEYRSALVEGAEQAANPRLPEVETFWTLRRALDGLGERYPTALRICLDPYRAELGLGELIAEGARRDGRVDAASPLIVAVGSERGWTEAELELFAERGYAFARLGGRILKSETAAVAAAAIAMAGLGYL